MEQLFQCCFCNHVVTELNSSLSWHLFLIEIAKCILMLYLMTENSCLQNGQFFQTVRVCTGYIPLGIVCGHKSTWLISELYCMHQNLPFMSTHHTEGTLQLLKH